LQDLCSFSTSFGKVSYTVLPFGAEFASEKFQQAIHHTFGEFLNLFLLVYIDNLIIHTNSVEQHMSALKKIFTVCRTTNLKLQKSKCTFLSDTIHTLGFIVSKGHIQPDPKKIQTLINSAPPADIKQLRSYLSLLQQFRDVLPHISHVCHPLYAATSDKKPFQWDSNLQQSFNISKDMLTKELIRHEFDTNSQSIIYMLKAGMQVN
jgi:Reverse transcriptase (RNA-dependent DNA polymerase)